MDLINFVITWFVKNESKLENLFVLNVQTSMPVVKYCSIPNSGIKMQCLVCSCLQIPVQRWKSTLLVWEVCSVHNSSSSIAGRRDASSQMGCYYLVFTYLAIENLNANECGGIGKGCFC